MRTNSVNSTGGVWPDWSVKSPWRAPGTAPVLGSGCGLGGGNAIPLPNGGHHTMQGFDGADLPGQQPAVWQRGSTQEVAFGINTNHGGGYHYRLCKLGGNVSEACFQRLPLKFASDKHTVHFTPVSQNGVMVELPTYEIPLVKTATGTYPPGSEWARVPIPGCRLCDQSICGESIPPNMSAIFTPSDVSGGGDFPGEWHGGEPWFKQQLCNQGCTGLNFTACPPGLTQFAEPLPGLSGYFPPGYPTVDGLPYSIVDKVSIPEYIEPGQYLLSWRWDCEQSNQIWQNCADISIL